MTRDLAHGRLAELRDDDVGDRCVRRRNDPICDHEATMGLVGDLETMTAPFRHVCYQLPQGVEHSSVSENYVV